MKGFTLIETMVAIAILTLAVAGPLYTASRAIVAAQNARDQLTASYLAQEGIEYVRALRDKAFLAVHSADATRAWPDFLSATTQCDATTNAIQACTLDPMTGLSILSCTVGSTCAPLYRRLDGLYTQQSGGGDYTRTAFTRTIQVVNVSAIDERIISTVSWSSHGTPYTVKIYDHLTPWQ